LAHNWQAEEEKITNIDISAKSIECAHRTKQIVLSQYLETRAFANTRIIICYSSNSYQGWGQQKSRGPMDQQKFSR
jgi:hypothetical protein